MGQPQGGFGQAGAMMGAAGFGGGLAGAAGARPTKRNPIIPLVIVIAGSVGANVLMSVLASITGVYVLANLGSLVGMLVFGFVMFRMASELKNFANSDLAPWMAFVPCLNLWFVVLKVPQEMAKAKQMAGIQTPTRPVWMYFLIGAYALAADLNDLAGP